VKKLLTVLTAVFVTACFCCAVYADLAPIPEEWLHPAVNDDPPQGEQAQAGETAQTSPDAPSSPDPAPAGPSDPEPEPANPAPTPAPVPETGCSHLSVTLVCLAGGIVFIAGGVLGYIVARHRREVPVK
jgi:hypothetical protein